ncbi:Glycerol kinase [hydrothermal vent metagenome]|uniref:Glycerol kinase n=1 Tax=hydrothermal vent metagenome TaxID=652676 RepID=A0A3B1BHM8_9ZZZZ
MSQDFTAINNLYLCLDQGGQASRAMVFDNHGQLIAQARESLEAQQPGNDRVEYPAEELLASIRRAIEKVLDILGERRHNISAAGLATQRSNIACWDRQTGEALMPILGWQDRRAHQWLQRLKPQTDTIHRRTGLFLNPYCGASKLRWCLDNIAEVKQAADQERLAFGPMASFIIYRLLDEHPLLTDPVNASRTQLLNIRSHDWDPEQLKLFALPAQALPTVVPNLHTFGTLSIQDISIPLRLLNGDQSTAIYAYGAVQPDTAYVNIGTGAFVSRPSGMARIFSSYLLTSLVLQKENKDCDYVLEGTVNGAASALKWLAREEGIDNIFEQLGDWLKQTEQPPVFLNGIGGLGSPWWIADFKSRFHGQGSQQEKAVAVAESIIFMLNINLEKMHHLASPPEQLQITGGLAQIDGLCQRLADLSNLPVYRPRESEATARGIAFLLAERPEHWPETDIGIWFTPQPNTALKARYTEWNMLMQNELKAMNQQSRQVS